jgi:hypothetical protein
MVARLKANCPTLTDKQAIKIAALWVTEVYQICSTAVEAAAEEVQNQRTQEN